MEFISVSEVSKKWNISDRMVRKYCVEGKISGAFLMGKTWNIPVDAEKPGKKTIYSIAISFSYSHTYVINNDDISEIAALLCVDYKLLHKAINYCINGVMPAEMIKIGEKYLNQKQIKNADLFSAIVRMYFIYKNIDNI